MSSGVCQNMPHASGYASIYETQAHDRIVGDTQSLAITVEGPAAVHSSKDVDEDDTDVAMAKAFSQSVDQRSGTGQRHNAMV